MSKKVYELTISSNYVHTWGVEEAVREIMQNAIDSETDGNLLSVSYGSGTLRIQNEGCNLDISSLVLGNSGKHDTTKYIGTYGEGFKLALIVLLRNGLNVIIYTNGQRWQPEFRKSNKFKVDTLHIDVDTGFDGYQDTIIFEIKGVEVNDFEAIRDKNLAMMKKMGFNIGEVIETEYGNILLDKRYKGMMFVNGLYVQYDNSFAYGYDFKPEYLHLDRDRKAINYYKMRELTAKAITSQNNIQLVSTAISRSYTDVKDIVEYMDNVTQEFKVNFANHFIKEHNIDEETFVGLKKEVEVAKREKSYITDSVAVAELVNYGLGKSEEYKEVKKKVQNQSKVDEAWNSYGGSDWKRLVEYLSDNKEKFDIDELVEKLRKLTDLHTTKFDLIEDEVFNDFYGEEDDE